MMKKRWLLAAALAALVSLAACGGANGGAEHEGDHGAASGGHAHGAGDAAPSAAEEDGGHGDHGGAEAAPAADLKASFSFAEGVAKANEETELTVRITDTSGNAVNDFEVNHEKLLHLIVVDHDLSFFAHLHPEFRGDGTFAVDAAFPSGGEYKVFADFVPAGGAAMTLSEWMKVEGAEGAHAEIEPDAALTKEIDGKSIELALSGTKANEETELTFTIRDAATGADIEDLEPYLGAVGHVVILSADAEQYLHVHPLDETSTGPKARFAATFPAPGLYKIWGQFQHQGEVFTVPFTIEAQ